MEETLKNLVEYVLEKCTALASLDEDAYLYYSLHTYADEGLPEIVKILRIVKEDLK